MTNTQKKENSRCLEYAQQHTLMLSLLLLFFGVLIVPRFYAQVQQSRHQKMDGEVKTIYFSQMSPTLSYVEITYIVGKNEYSVKELLNQHVKVGDHVEIHVSDDKKEIQFEKSSMIIPSLLLVAYVIILLLCLYNVFIFFMKKK
jgi:hypothetical protein